MAGKQQRSTKKNNLVIYQAKSGAIELRGDFECDTVWATQKQIAEIFGVTPQNITLHLKNIYKDGELKEKATCKECLQVQKEGTRTVKRKVKEYNLDVIIAVGYRINSVIGTHFRIWATKIIKQHITEGYTINKRVLKKNYEAFLTALEDVKKLSGASGAVKPVDVLELVKSFADTWFSLEAYDKDTFPQKGFTKKRVKMEAHELHDAVAKFKEELIKKKEATELFAQEKKQNALEGIVGNVFQSMFGEDAYKTVEEKAAHLLYFIVKNHPFNDGNKRTGAFSFIWFLNKSGMKFKDTITPEALTTITLLIAESKPKDKERMIGLVMLLLKGRRQK